MSQLVVDDTLLDDMASALRALRQYFMELAEQHAEMDSSALDELLRRYDEEQRT